jgi:hypothetical protein
MDPTTLALITRLFEENAALRKENDELKSKIAPVKAKKAVDPNKPKKKYGKLDEKTLAAVRHENGMKLAAWNKSKKETQETEDFSEKPVKNTEEIDLIRNWNIFPRFAI